jgi:hypothetical protein
MQHNEVEEEAFVAPDTQGDADSPFVAPSAFGRLPGQEARSAPPMAPAGATIRNRRS